MKKMRNTSKSSLEDLTGRDHLGDRDIGGRIILR
jgi:hypothetical protein